MEIKVKQNADKAKQSVIHKLCTKYNYNKHYDKAEAEEELPLASTEEVGFFSETYSGRSS